jgi:hypothetical protein
MQLKSAYLFILQESPIKHKKVRADIVAVTRKLPSNPDRYAPDKYKLNNDGSYRLLRNINTESFTEYVKMKFAYYGYGTQR